MWGKFLNESPSGIWKDVWQTGHLIVVCNCFLANSVCLSRHVRQNEWRHGKVLGPLTVPKQSGHSASCLRLAKSWRISIFQLKRLEHAGQWGSGKFYMHDKPTATGAEQCLEMHSWVHRSQGVARVSLSPYVSYGNPLRNWTEQKPVFNTSRK